MKIPKALLELRKQYGDEKGKVLLTKNNWYLIREDATPFHRRWKKPVYLYRVYFCDEGVGECFLSLTSLKRSEAFDHFKFQSKER